MQNKTRNKMEGIGDGKDRRSSPQLGGVEKVEVKNGRRERKEQRGKKGKKRRKGEMKEKEHMKLLQLLLTQQYSQK